MKIKIAVPFFLVATVAILISFSSGVGMYTFYYADGMSYFKNDPKSCMNCHVMKGHYDSWNKSSHRNVATCNSCHAPHDSLGKFTTKAINGFNHSWAFTFNSYKDPIRIKKWNKNITLSTCISCHKNVHHEMVKLDDSVTCISCHKNVGHL